MGTPKEHKLAHPPPRTRQKNLNWFLRPTPLVMGTRKELELVLAAVAPSLLVMDTPKEFELVLAAVATFHKHAERT
jgi:hypothetical protein